jgi:hypothetical protein
MTLQTKLDVVGVLIEEGERRVRRSLDSREPADGSAGFALLDAAAILVRDCEIEAMAFGNAEHEVQA